mgnify:CR=1 FL=1
MSGMEPVTRIKSWIQELSAPGWIAAGIGALQLVTSFENPQGSMTVPNTLTTVVFRLGWTLLATWTVDHMYKAGHTTTAWLLCFFWPGVATLFANLVVSQIVDQKFLCIKDAQGNCYYV